MSASCIASELRARHDDGPSSKPRRSFKAHGADDKVIREVLRKYTVASSTRNEAPFRSLLLNDEIQISDADAAAEARGRPHGTENYRDFRRGFSEPPHTMRFERIHIDGDGPLAQASLVFIKRSAEESSWGWEIIHLLKVDDQWKIASKLFTYHSLTGKPQAAKVRAD